MNSRDLSIGVQDYLIMQSQPGGSTGCGGTADTEADIGECNNRRQVVMEIKPLF